MSYIQQHIKQAQEDIAQIRDTIASVRAGKAQAQEALEQAQRDLDSLNAQEQSLRFAQNEAQDLLAILQEREDGGSIEPVEDQAQVPDSIPPEVERVTRERAEAPPVEPPAQPTGPRPHKRSKPDPVKAAKKAAKAKAKTSQSTPPPNGGSRYARDPLHTHRQSAPKQGKTYPKGTKKPRLTDLRPGDIDGTKFTPTDMARADFLEQMMVENGGAMDQVTMTREWAELMDTLPQTAQSQISRTLRVLVHFRRVLFCQKVPAPGTDSGNRVALWKTIATATPPERAAAGMGLDDDYAGTTTRWPTGGRAPAQGSRIQVETSAFESKR